MTEIDLSKNYVPNPGVDNRPNQIDFHTGRHKSTFRVCICGQRAGKTIANVAECIFWSQSYPRSVGWLGAPDYQMMKRIIIPALHKVLGVHSIINSPLVLEYNKTDHMIRFKNESILWLGSMDNPEKVEGITLDYAGLDEGRLVKNWDPESLNSCWTILKARLSGTGALPKGVFPQLWITTTPAPVESDLWRLFALESDSEFRVDDVQLFSWFQADNRTLDEHYLKMQKATVKTKAQQDAFLYGAWPSMGTGMFPFDYNRHVIRDWSLIPEDDLIKRVIYGVDWGYAPDPFVIVVILIDNHNRCYVVDEFYEVEFDTSRRWEAAQDMVDKWGKGVFWCDRAEPGSIAQFTNHGIDAKKDQSKKEDGLAFLIGQFYDVGDKPMLMFWHECRHTIHEMSQYDPEQKDCADHAIDASRYTLANTFVGSKLYMGAVSRDVKRPRKGRR